MNNKEIEHMKNINMTYDSMNQPYINDDTVQINYSFRRDRHGLGQSKGFEPKYYASENPNYINQIDKQRENNIDPIYKENKIISNDKLFLTNNESNITPLFLTQNDYNIQKGLNNRNIIDPIF
jgi:hypothetical protein